jgi:arylsulfatase A-like enzyme
MNRRHFLATAAAAPLAAQSPRPPNVLFVLVDQWRFSAFSHSTDPVVQTPHIDRLASQSALFRRAYATNPVCTPNRSCIVTSRYCQHRMVGNDIMLPPENTPCMAEVFHAGSYDTHYIGKWHMDGDERPGFVPHGWRRRGFETFEGFNRGHFYYESPTFTNDGAPLPIDGFEPVGQADLAIDYMKARRDKPFFCYLSWGPPHTPYRPPQGYQKYLEPGAKLEWRDNVPKEWRESELGRKELGGYYGLCEALDSEMGRILKFLDDSGLAENTVVVFTADHGDMHGSHNMTRKGKPEDESLHVPLIVRWPGRVGVSEIHTLATSIDLMPTLLSMAGLDVPGRCEGRDLSSALLHGRPPQVDSLYTQGAMTSAQNQWRALVTPTHKLAVYGNGENTKLFDLEHDPYELVNLAGKREHASLEKHLRDHLMKKGKETGDPFPAAAPKAKVLYTDEEAERARERAGA